MLSSRVIPPGVLLAGLLALPGVTLHAADGDSPAAPVPLVKKDAALDALTEKEPITAETYARPVPRARPRLKDGDVLSEQGRVRVHGGMSLTVGASSEGSFHGASGWVSYYDPVTGLGLSVGISRMSGAGLPLDYTRYPYGSRYRATPDILHPIWVQPPAEDLRDTPPLFMRGASKTGTEDARGALLVDRDGHR